MLARFLLIIEPELFIAHVLQNVRRRFAKNLLGQLFFLVGTGAAAPVPNLPRKRGSARFQVAGKCFIRVSMFL